MNKETNGYWAAHPYGRIPMNKCGRDERESPTRKHYSDNCCRQLSTDGC